MRFIQKKSLHSSEIAKLMIYICCVAIFIWILMAKL